MNIVYRRKIKYRKKRFRLHLLLGYALVKGQIGVGVSVHSHSAHYLLVVVSECYQENKCFEVSPKIIRPFSSCFCISELLPFSTDQ